MRIHRSTSTDREIGAGANALLSLAAGDRDNALIWLGTAVEKARRHEPDQAFYGLMLIKHNVMAYPMLEEAAFRELRAELGTL